MAIAIKYPIVLKIPQINKKNKTPKKLFGCVKSQAKIPEPIEMEMAKTPTIHPKLESSLLIILKFLTKLRPNHLSFRKQSVYLYSLNE